MIELKVTRMVPEEEVVEFESVVNPQSVFEDVAILQDQMKEVLNILSNLDSNFVPEEASDLNDKDLNTCIGKVIFGYGNNCLNKPNNANGYLINIPHNSRGDLFNKQIWITRPANNIFVRNMENGTFGNWSPVQVDSGWAALPLASGISEQNSSQYPCRYRKVNNQIFVDGCVKGVSAVNTVVATLPEGARPSKSYYYQGATDKGKTDTFRVHTNGNIELIWTTGEVGVSQYHFITTSFLND